MADLRRKLPYIVLSEVDFAFLQHSPTCDIFSHENKFAYENSLLWQKRKWRGVSMWCFDEIPLGHLIFRALYMLWVLKALMDSRAFVRTMNYVYTCCPEEVRPGQRVFLLAPWVSFELSMVGCQYLNILRQAVWSSLVHTPWSSHLPPNVGIVAKNSWLFLLPTLSLTY